MCQFLWQVDIWHTGNLSIFSLLFSTLLIFRATNIIVDGTSSIIIHQDIHGICLHVLFFKILFLNVRNLFRNPYKFYNNNKFSYSWPKSLQINNIEQFFYWSLHLAGVAWLVSFISFIDKKVQNVVGILDTDPCFLFKILSVFKWKLLCEFSACDVILNGNSSFIYT